MRIHNALLGVRYESNGILMNKKTYVLILVALVAVAVFTLVERNRRYQNNPDVIAAKQAGYNVEAYVKVSELQRKYQSATAVDPGDLKVLESLALDTNQFIQTRAISAVRNFAKLGEREECLNILESAYTLSKNDLPRSNALRSLAKLDSAHAKAAVARVTPTGELTIEVARELTLSK